MSLRIGASTDGWIVHRSQTIPVSTHKGTKARKGIAKKSRLEGVVSELSLMDQSNLFDRQGCKAWLPMRLRGGGGYLELGSLASAESDRDSVSWTAVREKG